MTPDDLRDWDRAENDEWRADRQQQRRDEHDRDEDEDEDDT